MRKNPPPSVYAITLGFLLVLVITSLFCYVKDFGIIPIDAEKIHQIRAESTL